jgi:hypothetical protein
MVAVWMLLFFSVMQEKTFIDLYKLYEYEIGLVVAIACI